MRDEHLSVTYLDRFTVPGFKSLLLLTFFFLKMEEIFNLYA